MPCNSHCSSKENLENILSSLRHTGARGKGDVFKRSNIKCHMFLLIYLLLDMSETESGGNSLSSHEFNRSMLILLQLKFWPQPTCAIGLIWHSALNQHQARTYLGYLAAADKSHNLLPFSYLLICLKCHQKIRELPRK